VTLSIALTEPQYHVNVGHVSRLMKNFGLRRLYLIRPSFDAFEAIKYSTHGKDILESASELRSIEQLRNSFDILIGTTAIHSASRLNILRVRTYPEEMARVINESKNSRKICLLLGRESSGLTNKELELCDMVVGIDTRTTYKTMNIAHALAILLYEVSKLRAVKKKNTGQRVTKKIDPASKRDLNLLLLYLDKLAHTSNYDEHKMKLLHHSFKRILATSSPNVKDVMLIVSLFRKSLLAIDRSSERGSRPTRNKT
jgi:tRNA/rRNA methyltransferase